MIIPQHVFNLELLNLFVKTNDDLKGDSLIMQHFSAAKAALDMQMSVSQSVRKSVCL